MKFSSIITLNALLVTTTTPATLATLSKGDFDAADCPKISYCVKGTCGEPGLNLTIPIETTVVHGVALPSLATVETNFPILNAGLYFYRRYGSDEYLLWALRRVCKPQEGQNIKCDPHELGQAIGSSFENDVFPVWTRTATLKAQTESCMKYAQELATKDYDGDRHPEFGLRSHPLSLEGMRIRKNLAQLISAAATIREKCGRSGLSQPCAMVPALFDDLRFDFLLADKVISDGFLAPAGALLDAGEVATTHLSVLAQNLRAAGDLKVSDFDFSLMHILDTDWITVRAAIHDGLGVVQ